MMSQAEPWVIPPLPRHPPPQPDEELASLLMRTAGSMGYDTPHWILRPEAPLPTIDGSTPILWLRKQADYHLLEQFLLLEQAQFYRLTLHRFAVRLQAPTAAPANSLHEIQRPFLSRATRVRFFLPAQTTQVCPACLAEGLAYGRVFWPCHYVTFCPQHRTGLIQHCPVCQAPIPALRQTLTTCPVCRRGDYRMAPPPPRAEHVFLLSGQAMLLERLGCDGGEAPNESGEAAPTPLHGLHPWHYFQLLDSFRSLLAPLVPQQPWLESNAALSNGRLPGWIPAPERGLSERAWLIATFHALFTDWPNRFFALLEAFRCREQTTQRAPGIRRDFGSFYRQQVLTYLNDPALAFVSDTFAEYLSRQYTGGPVHSHLVVFQRLGAELLQDRPYLTLDQASRLLGIYRGTVHILLQKGLLTETPRPKRTDGHRMLVLIEKASVEALRQAWDPLLPMEHVATALLGIPPGTMAGLARTKLLCPIQGPDVDGYPVSLYHPEAIEHLTRMILSLAVAAPADLSEVIPVGQLYRGQSPWNSLAHTVVAILKGLLIPIDLKMQAPLFQRLVVPKQGVFLPRSPGEQERISHLHHESEVQAMGA